MQLKKKDKEKNKKELLIKLIKQLLEATSVDKTRQYGMHWNTILTDIIPYIGKLSLLPTVCLIIIVSSHINCYSSSGWNCCESLYILYIIQSNMDFSAFTAYYRPCTLVFLVLLVSLEFNKYQLTQNKFKIINQLILTPKVLTTCLVNTTHMLTQFISYQ